MGPEQTSFTQLAGIPDFRRASRELVVFNKARVTGDCGTYQVFGFGPDGEPFLKVLRAKLTCDGRATEPKDYPSYPPGS